MKNYTRYLLPLGIAGLFGVNASATNPLIMDQFTADPTARVFEGKMYVYPSHDIPYSPGKGRTNWFIMEDYHVFSSENLNDWTDHGVIVSQTTVPWTDPNGYAMWAPDCVSKDGKYYFYFPAPGKPVQGQRGGGSRIGVAIADKPQGPYTPQPTAIEGVGGIDPCVLIDKDGSAYLYTSAGRISVAKLKPNMVEIETRPMVITNLPTRGLIEGPFVFERKGIYYLTYPHVEKNIERLEYATSTNPMGPFKFAGVILDEAESGCWTVHHSIVEYNGQWILFYHDKDLSPGFDKNRSIRADYLYFNDDGTIKKVIPTLRGVGIVDAKSKIQIDRYSEINKECSVSYLSTNTFDGWKVSLGGTNGWVRFNAVDFGKKRVKAVNVRSASSTGGLVEIRLDKIDGPVIAKVNIDKGSDWKVVTAKSSVGAFKQLFSKPTKGVHDIFVTQQGGNAVDLDWISFE